MDGVSGKEEEWNVGSVSCLFGEGKERQDVVHTKQRLSLSSGSRLKKEKKKWMMCVFAYR